MGKQVKLEKEDQFKIDREVLEGNVRYNLHKGLRERQYEAWCKLKEALDRLSCKQEFKEAG